MMTRKKKTKRMRTRKKSRRSSGNPSPTSSISPRTKAPDLLDHLVGARAIAKDDFANPSDRVVNSLVGPASDLHFFGQRWDYDTGDHCDAIKAARAIDERGYEDILQRAEKAAADFVRDHEREIIPVGDYLYRKGEASGLEIRVLLSRLPEDVPQHKGSGAVYDGPKRKPAQEEKGPRRF
jgi:hypothetical protein